MWSMKMNQSASPRQASSRRSRRSVWTWTVSTSGPGKRSVTISTSPHLAKNPRAAVMSHIRMPLSAWQPGRSSGLRSDPAALGRLTGSRRVLGTRRRHKSVFEVRDRHRAAEEITLPLQASHAQEEIGGCPIFDAFGDHRKPELLAEPDGRTDDRGIVGIDE